MPEFLETIESIRAEEASVQKLFNAREDGVGVRTLRGRANIPDYAKRLAEAAVFMADVYTGRRPYHHLQEAMTTSDFPLLFGDVLDRQLLGNYQEASYSWKSLVKRNLVRDFRTVSRHAINKGEAVLDVVLEKQNYPAASIDEAEYEYAVKKYGRRIPFSWEDMINDDLGAFRDIPERLGKAARRSEEKFVTELFVDASGPHASFFTAGNSNLLSGNPVLSTANLGTAIEKLLAQTDADGEPILVEAMTLWVPPALWVTASNIKNALQLEWNEEGGSSNTRVVTGNWLARSLMIEIGSYIPIVATSNGATSWFLFADPQSGRPAGEMGFLRGHEQPEIFMKTPNVQRVSGGPVDGMVGDFDSDSVEYKLRHVFGGTRMDPKSAVASNGSGS